MLEGLEAPIEYDKYGRMSYNPIFHENNGKPWYKEDTQYLIDWYDIIGPEEISFAIDRTIKSVMHKATLLRKGGKMKKPLKKTTCKRIKKNPLARVQVKQI
ncbi:hypothetical protein [Clostridium tagluense]|uniref:Uncharacterized protein n=1 Tax=Clostridium tagluense TaxID=360422 RepID=A0A401UUE4_9CLOT|nr:hypothetical protein [Clostridium tagluense]GCD13172.1 hypothetical protein Ctaglu_47950 [Clostridium tagluense]